MFKAQGLAIYCEVHKTCRSKENDNNRTKGNLVINGNTLQLFKVTSK